MHRAFAHPVDRRRVHSELREGFLTHTCAGADKSVREVNEPPEHVGKAEKRGAQCSNKNNALGEKEKSNIANLGGEQARTSNVSVKGHASKAAETSVQDKQTDREKS